MLTVHNSAAPPSAARDFHQRPGTAKIRTRLHSHRPRHNDGPHPAKLDLKVITGIFWRMRVSQSAGLGFGSSASGAWPSTVRPSAALLKGQAVWLWDPSLSYKHLSAQHGLTLIELLTAMAILVLLVALAVPALVRSMEKARMSRDSANLRQIGAGLPLFAGDNEGRLPEAGGDIP